MGKKFIRKIKSLNKKQKIILMTSAFFLFVAIVAVTYFIIEIHKGPKFNPGPVIKPVSFLTTREEVFLPRIFYANTDVPKSEEVEDKMYPDNPLDGPEVGVADPSPSEGSNKNYPDDFTGFEDKDGDINVEGQIPKGSIPDSDIEGNSLVQVANDFNHINHPYKGWDLRKQIPAIISASTNPSDILQVFYKEETNQCLRIQYKYRDEFIDIQMSVKEAKDKNC